MNVSSSESGPTRRYWRDRHVVYRLYGGGVLLYVGASSDVAMRIAAHSRTALWFHRVDRISIKVFPRRLDAFRAELEAIRTERPAHNIRHAA